MCQTTKGLSCTDGHPDLRGHEPQIFLGFFVFYANFEKSPEHLATRQEIFLTLIKWPCTMANVYSLHPDPT